MKIEIAALKKFVAPEELPEIERRAAEVANEHCDALFDADSLLMLETLAEGYPDEFPGLVELFNLFDDESDSDESKEDEPSEPEENVATEPPKSKKTSRKKSKKNA